MISLSKIASLANLPDENTKDYEKKLDETLEFVEIIKTAKTTNVDPTFQVNGKINGFREDIVESKRIIHSGKYNAKISWTN